MLLLPRLATPVACDQGTSPWSVLEAEDGREEVDEPSHAESPLAAIPLPSFASARAGTTAPVVATNVAS